MEEVLARRPAHANPPLSGWTHQLRANESRFLLDCTLSAQKNLEPLRASYRLLDAGFDRTLDTAARFAVNSRGSIMRS
jgi:hypothetical protein